MCVYLCLFLSFFSSLSFVIYYFDTSIYTHSCTVIKKKEKRATQTHTSHSHTYISYNIYERRKYYWRGRISREVDTWEMTFGAHTCTILTPDPFYPPLSLTHSLSLFLTDYPTVSLWCYDDVPLELTHSIYLFLFRYICTFLSIYLSTSLYLCHHRVWLLYTHRATPTFLRMCITLFVSPWTSHTTLFMTTPTRLILCVFLYVPHISLPLFLRFYFTSYLIYLSLRPSSKSPTFPSRPMAWKINVCRKLRSAVGSCHSLSLLSGPYIYLYIWISHSSRYIHTHTCLINFVTWFILRFRTGTLYWKLIGRNCRMIHVYYNALYIYWRNRGCNLREELFHHPLEKHVFHVVYGLSRPARRI